MARFEKHIDALIRKEGGYKLVDVKHDRGGRTYAGISERSHPDWPGWAALDEGASPARMEGLVQAVYRDKYWNAIWGDDIDSDLVAEMMFSSAVLSGARRSVRMAQQCSGAESDGLMGPNTLKAINSMEPDLFEARFTLARIDRYRKICNRDRSQVKFLLGWLNRAMAESEG